MSAKNALSRSFTKQDDDFGFLTEWRGWTRSPFEGQRRSTWKRTNQAYLLYVLTNANAARESMLLTHRYLLLHVQLAPCLLVKGLLRLHTRAKNCGHKTVQRRGKISPTDSWISSRRATPRIIKRRTIELKQTESCQLLNLPALPERRNAAGAKSPRMPCVP